MQQVRRDFGRGEIEEMTTNAKVMRLVRSLPLLARMRGVRTMFMCMRGIAAGRIGPVATGCRTSLDHARCLQSMEGKINPSVRPWRCAAAGPLLKKQADQHANAHPSCHVHTSRRTKSNVYWMSTPRTLVRQGQASSGLVNTTGLQQQLRYNVAAT